jgi:anti-sigma factor RsiW
VSAHIGELAELYALGSLDDRERAHVDEHVKQCDACAAELGSAERAVVALLSERAPAPALDRRMTAAFAPRPAWRTWAPLIAAAFVLGLIPALWFTRPSPSPNSQAIVAMAGSHFAHAQFTALTPSAPKAKLVYARTGAWWYVIAQTSRAYTLAAEEKTRIVRIGILRVDGNAAQLYIANPPAARTLLLLDGSKAVARVTLPYRR